MAKLYVCTSFQYKGRIVRCGEAPEDAVLNIPFEELEEQKALGKHKRTKKWNSPLFNHCLPADNAAKEVFGEKPKKSDLSQEEKKEKEEAEIVELRKQFDDIGAGYDPRWKVQRLTEELVKAKKLRGE